MEILAVVSSGPAPQVDCLPLLLPPCGHRMALAPYSLPPPPPGGMKVHVYMSFCMCIFDTKMYMYMYMYVYTVKFDKQ